MLPLNTSCKAGLAQSHQKDMPNPKNGCRRAAGKLLGNWVPEALVVLQYLEQHGLPMPTLGLAHSVQLLDLIAAIPPPFLATSATKSWPTAAINPGCCVKMCSVFKSGSKHQLVNPKKILTICQWD
jgi:hypothetical protein